MLKIEEPRMTKKIPTITENTEANLLEQIDELRAQLEEVATDAQGH